MERICQASRIRQVRRIFAEFAEKANKDGSGIVDYLWPRPGSDDPVGKSSYIAKFEPWGWVIGTGVYTDDLHALFWKRAKTELAIACFALLIAVMLAALVIRSVKPIAGMTDTMAKLAGNETDVVVPALDQNDEIGQMAQAVEIFRNNAIERRTLEAETLKEALAKERRRVAAGRTDPRLQSLGQWHAAERGRRLDRTARHRTVHG